MRGGGIYRRQTYRILKLFVLWTIIYLPLTIYYYVQNDFGIFKSLLLFVRNTVLIGENYMSWPLWYLNALLFSLIVAGLMIRYGAKVWNLFLTGLLLMFIGTLFNTVQGNVVEQSVTTRIINLYYSVAATTRNGLFTGFGYVAAGMMAAKYYEWFNKYLLGVFLLFLVSLILFVLDIPCSGMFVVMFFTFLLAYIRMPDSKFYVVLRNTSTFIYFTHMIILALLKIFFRLDLSDVSLFIYTCIGSLALSAVLVWAKEKTRFAFLKNLM